VYFVLLFLDYGHYCILHIAFFFGSFFEISVFLLVPRSILLFCWPCFAVWVALIFSVIAGLGKEYCWSGKNIAGLEENN